MACLSHNLHQKPQMTVPEKRFQGAALSVRQNGLKFSLVPLRAVNIGKCRRQPVSLIQFDVEMCRSQFFRKFSGLKLLCRNIGLNLNPLPPGISDGVHHCNGHIVNGLRKADLVITVVQFLHGALKADQLQETNIVHDARRGDKGSEKKHRKGRCHQSDAPGTPPSGVLSRRSRCRSFFHIFLINIADCFKQIIFVHIVIPSFSRYCLSALRRRNSMVFTLPSDTPRRAPMSRTESQNQ